MTDILAVIKKVYFIRFLRNFHCLALNFGGSNKESSFFTFTLLFFYQSLYSGHCPENIQSEISGDLSHY